MNEFDLIAIMLWELNAELEKQSGFQHSRFRDYHNRLTVLLSRMKGVREAVTSDYDPIPESPPHDHP